MDAPAEEVWELVADPADLPALHARHHALRRARTATTSRRAGLGARYRMLMHVGSADVGGLIEIVEYDDGRDLAWTSVTGIDQRGRWRLRDAGGRAHAGHAAAELRRPGRRRSGAITERLSAPRGARTTSSDGLERLKAELEGEHVGERAGTRD